MTNDPKIVLIPTEIMGQPFRRLCFFLGFGACKVMVAVEDSGLLMGKSGKISVLAKNRGQQYTYPAERAVFAFDGATL